MRCWPPGPWPRSRTCSLAGPMQLRCRSPRSTACASWPPCSRGTLAAGGCAPRDRRPDPAIRQAPAHLVPPPAAPSFSRWRLTGETDAALAAVAAWPGHQVARKVRVQCGQARPVGRAGAKADHAVGPDQHGAALGHAGPGGVEARSRPVDHLDQPGPAGAQPVQVGVAEDEEMMAGAGQPAPIGKARAGGWRAGRTARHRTPRPAGCRRRRRPASRGCAGWPDRAPHPAAASAGAAADAKVATSPMTVSCTWSETSSTCWSAAPRSIAKLSSSVGGPRRAAPGPASRRCRPRPSAPCSGPRRRTGWRDGRHRPAGTAGRRPVAARCDCASGSRRSTLTSWMPASRPTRSFTSAASSRSSGAGRHPSRRRSRT